MAKKQKASYLKKLLIITTPIILIQAGLLFKLKSDSNSSTESLDDIVSAEIASGDIDSSQAAEIRVYMAINGYRSMKEEYPNQLNDLVPEFLNEVPVDPRTSEPFQYTKDGDNFHLGSAATQQTQVASADAKTGEVPQVLQSEEDMLLASLKSFDDQLFIYDPTGKRDPFRKIDLDKFSSKNRGKTPLEQFDYPNFRISAVLLDSGEPKAIVEDGNGKGHTVRIGTKIGLYDGKVYEITEEKMVIEETTIDFTGEKNTRYVDIVVPVKENDYGTLGKEGSIGEGASYSTN